MVRIDGREALYRIKREVGSRVDKELRANSRPPSTIRTLLFKDFTQEPINRKDNTDLLHRCYRLDPQAREICLDLIFQILLNSKIGSLDLDAMLADYYINYFGKPTDLTSSMNNLGLGMIRKILISQESSPEVKLRKLAQVVYQDLYGVGILDEFLYMEIEPNGKKIEEIASFGPNCLWFAASGVPTKLDKVYVPPNVLRSIVDRLSVNEPEILLNKNNPSISTDSLNRDRITLTCPDYTRFYDFNIRRHYPGTITREDMIRNGSSTEEYECFLDLIMKFYPRIILTGDQAAGKTTRLRMIAERYPPNTVIGTIESSFELELSKVNHLIVKQLKANNLGPDKALEDSLRFGLHVMANGETRNGREVETVLQAGQRSSKGTLTSSHAPTAWDCIRSYVQMLIKEKVFTNERSALYYISQCIDFIIVPAVDNNGVNATGFRYIDAVYELPKLKEYEMDNFEPRLLFKADKNTFKLHKIDVISNSTLDFLNKRQPNDEIIRKLGSGNYV